MFLLFVRLNYQKTLPPKRQKLHVFKYNFVWACFTITLGKKRNFWSKCRRQIGLTPYIYISPVGGRGGPNFDTFSAGREPRNFWKNASYRRKKQMKSCEGAPGKSCEGAPGKSCEGAKKQGTYGRAPSQPSKSQISPKSPVSSLGSAERTQFKNVPKKRAISHPLFRRKNDFFA